jgi:hypothetical protein
MVRVYIWCTAEAEFISIFHEKNSYAPPIIRDPCEQFNSSGMIVDPMARMAQSNASKAAIAGSRIGLPRGR